MLEFMSERKHTAQKEYTCDICGWAIHKGEQYYRYAAKYEGEMLDYCHHVHCRNMSVEYCEEQGENEYDTGNIADYLYDRFCCDCIHGANEESDCEFSAYECPKLIERFSERTMKDEKKAEPKIHDNEGTV